MESTAKPVSVTQREPTARKPLKEWQQECYKLVRDSVLSKDNRLLDVMMGLGKTWSAGHLVTDRSVNLPLTVLSPLVDTREQIRDYALTSGADQKSVIMLPRVFVDCPTAAGEYDDKQVSSDLDITWSELISRLQQQLVTPSHIHKKLDELLPCQADGKCPYVRKCDFDIASVDLLIGHPIHAKVDSYVRNRAVLFDERSAQAFQYEVSLSEFTTAINHYLEKIDGVCADTFNDLIRATDQEKDRWSELIRDDGPLIDPELGYSRYGGRADTRLLILGILQGEPVSTDGLTIDTLRRAKVEGKVVLYDEGEGHNNSILLVRNPPSELEAAYSVTAMDGTPSVPLWNGCLGVEFEYIPHMNRGQKRRYIRDTLGYDIVQLTPDRTVPATNPNNIKEWIFNGYLHEISKKHGGPIPVITTKKARQALDSRYISNDEIYYGKIRSRSDLEDEQVLVVLGSWHPGDRVIQRYAAMDGVAVKSNGLRGPKKSYGAVGDHYYKQIVHDEILQAIFRVGRSRDTYGATIYVYTCLLPDWVPRKVINEKPSKWSHSCKDIFDILENCDSVYKDQLVEETGRSMNTIHRWLKRLEDAGFVEKVSGYGYSEWKPTSVEERNPYGIFHIDP